jgi:mono/diheme cytochrome c family protein
MESFWSWRVLRRRGAIGCIVVAATILGCRAVPVELAAPEVQRLNAPIARVGELETGRVIYTSRQKCARCHQPKRVTDHTAADWSETILPRMAKKAKLSDLERQYVLNYILTARSIGNQTVEAR